MNQNRINLAVLLGDPSGIGPELISKLLTGKNYRESKYCNYW
jgi:4-hydroxy-L-threonine phosphate dehydrogenase PdxA